MAEIAHCPACGGVFVGEKVSWAHRPHARCVCCFAVWVEHKPGVWVRCANPQEHVLREPQPIPGRLRLSPQQERKRNERNRKRRKR